MSAKRKAWVCSLDDCDGPHKAKGLCGKHYLGSWKARQADLPRPELTPELLRSVPVTRRPVTAEQRLWANVAIGEPDECWEWQGNRDPEGYGKIGVRRLVCATHRVAYILAHGPIADGLVVMHSCDNPPCCNPAHLSAGTGQENTRDMMAKGRAKFGGRLLQPRAS